MLAARSPKEHAKMQFFVGIDVSLEMSSICVIDERVVGEGRGLDAAARAAAPAGVGQGHMTAETG